MRGWRTVPQTMLPAASVFLSSMKTGEDARGARSEGSQNLVTGSRVCVWSGARGVRRDEHGAVAGELVVRLLAERDGGAHFRLFHHHRLQRPERPGAAARLSDHAKKCRRLHWT